MKYLDLKIGQSATLTKAFTDEDLRLFSQLSCDTNPIHLDEAYAKTTVFGQRIVYGMLVSSLISAVLANQLPGQGTIYLGQDLKFLAPVFIGEAITAKLEIVELRDDKKLVTLNCTCTKEDGTVVITGKSVVKHPV